MRFYKGYFATEVRVEFHIPQLKFDLKINGSSQI